MQICNGLFPFSSPGSLPSTSSPPSSSSSNSSTINLPLLHSLAMPPNCTLPSGLSVTITPATPVPIRPVGSTRSTRSPKAERPNHSSPINSTSTNSSAGNNSVTITKATAIGQSLTSDPTSLSPADQLRAALASTLQAIAATTSANLNSGACNAAPPAAAKPMNLNSLDELLTQEVTQRLVKVNREFLKGQPVAATNAAAGMRNSTSINTSTMNPEMKLAEKLVAELAAQQSTRNALHLNERTLQECWATLQRISCMIFMHKSALQLQQQAAAAAGVVHGGVGVGVNAGGAGDINQGQGATRAESVSSGGSENGAQVKAHQCHQCLKSFSSNHQLVQHIRVHTGEKPYKCSYCDRRFKQLSHVQQHTRLHTGERPYKCHVHDCGRAFIQLSNLQQHLRNHDAQLERSKNRPFHCGICGKGFATESSLRTHTTKVCKDQHTPIIGGPNAVTCPVCHKVFLGGEALMEHMKHTHKDPNASGVATKRRTANHPCPVCGKHYVNEGSLRKHLTCHPEAAGQLTSALRMWPCSVCQAVFTHETGLLTHMDQMRMDPKHQFAAQYVLSRAAAERRERDNILTAAAVAAMAGNHSFGPSNHGQTMSMVPGSPSGSESSGRLSSPLESNNSGLLQHSRISSSPLDARISSSGHHGIGMNHLMNKEYTTGKYEPYNQKPTYPSHQQLDGNLTMTSRDLHHSGAMNSIPSHLHHLENPNKFQMAGKVAALLSQGHQGHGHSPGAAGQPQPDLRNFMNPHQEELFQAEAFRLAIAERGGHSNNIGLSSHSQIQGQSQGQGVQNHSSFLDPHGQGLHRSAGGSDQNGNRHRNPNPVQNPSNLSHQLNSILSQPELSEALLRQLDARPLGFPLATLNS